MSEPDFDFIVIGGGSAGYAAASTAARLGLTVAVVEGAQDVGGLCILRGCMPSKTLLESSLRAEAIRHAGEFGLRAEYFGPDGAAIRARKRRLIADFAGYRKEQLESGRFAFVRGFAAFVDAHTVEVRLLDGGQRRLTARAFLISTGSEITVPPIEGLSEAGFWTSDDVLDTDHIPQSVCFLGGGTIAMELASYYVGLGVPTIVIQRSPRILKELDADLAEVVAETFVKRGGTLYCETKLQRVERSETGKVVHFEHQGQPMKVEAEQIVAALGRQPTTSKLALDRAGVATEGPRIPTGLDQRSNVPHIFAAGDVCGPYEIVHLAVTQGEISARNLARQLGRLKTPEEQMDYRTKLFAAFTYPKAAFVGLTEAECIEQGIDYVTAKYPFNDHGKSLVRGETEGFVKLIAARDTRVLLGAACVGPEASELIHETAVALHFRATAGDLLRVPHYHPTLSEIWTYPAEELAEA